MKNLLIMVFLWSCCLLSAGNPVPLADPFILLHDGTYYAYGTRSDNGIVVFSSKDLRHETRKPNG